MSLDLGQIFVIGTLSAVFLYALILLKDILNEEDAHERGVIRGAILQALQSGEMSTNELILAIQTDSPTLLTNENSFNSNLRFLEDHGMIVARSVEDVSIGRTRRVYKIAAREIKP